MKDRSWPRTASRHSALRSALAEYAHIRFPRGFSLNFASFHSRKAHNCRNSKLRLLWESNQDALTRRARGRAHRRERNRGRRSLLGSSFFRHRRYIDGRPWCRAKNACAATEVRTPSRACESLDNLVRSNFDVPYGNGRRSKTPCAVKRIADTPRCSEVQPICLLAMPQRKKSRTARGTTYLALPRFHRGGTSLNRIEREGPRIGPL